MVRIAERISSVVILKQARSAPLKNLGRGVHSNATSAFEHAAAGDGWHAHAEVTCGMKAHPRFFGCAALASE